MSRHTVAALSSAHSCDLGFDPGLATFYAQIINRERKRIADEAGERLDEAISSNQPYSEEDARAADDDAIILWVGTTPGELQTVEALAEAIAPYVQLNAETRSTLGRDKEREYHPPTGLQRAMHTFINEAGRG